MARFANSTLVAALRFVQELSSATSLAEFRGIVPAGLAGLISSDRVSLDEIEISAERCRVVPSPVPAWWSRLGELHQKHVHEHPLWDPARRIDCNQVISFSDFAGDEGWISSVLYNDYYVNLGVRYQLGVQIRRTGDQAVCLAFSRARRDFTPEDRALAELLSPHVGNAYRVVRALAATNLRPDEPDRAGVSSSHILAVTCNGKMIRFHTAGAIELLRGFFGCDTGVGDGLPDEVQRWLRIRQEWLRRGEIMASTIAPLVFHRDSRRLTIRLGCLRPDEATLLLECTGIGGNHAKLGATLATLTPREHEVLQWAGEGKRNNEIAIILGVSYRTVEKHFERIFAKLGVETRTAAIRHASEFHNGRHV